MKNKNNDTLTINVYLSNSAAAAKHRNGSQLSDEHCSKILTTPCSLCL